MPKKRWYGIVAAGIVLLLLLCGIRIYQDQFDPSVFTQAVLDVSYKNITDEYVRQTRTNQKTANAIFEEKIESAIEQFTEKGFTEELETEYRVLFEQIIKQVHYEIGETKKEADGDYTVAVYVRPILLLADTYETFQIRSQKYAENISNQVMAGEMMPTEQEMKIHLYQLYYEILQEKTEEGFLYGEQQKVILHIIKKEWFTYEIQKEDMEKLEKELIHIS